VYYPIFVQAWEREQMLEDVGTHDFSDDDEVADTDTSPSLPIAIDDKGASGRREGKLMIVQASETQTAQDLIRQAALGRLGLF
jgi:hypothetical protein